VNSHLVTTLRAACWVIAGWLTLAGSSGANAANPAPALGALDAMDAWLGDGPNGNRWREYLHTAEVRAELAKGDEADLAVIARQLQHFRSGAAGLDLAPFVDARKAVERWLEEQKQQLVEDLARLALASRGDHTPITEAQFAAIRQDLRAKVAALDSALAKQPSVVQAWKTYLLWNQLLPHLADDFEATSQSLTELDEVLRRFRTNELGLELPVFTDVAKAIARYRALAVWATAARTRDSRPVYERFLTDLSRVLERHTERPSMETARQVARGLGVVTSLGQSPFLVRTLRQHYAQPNVIGVVSTNFVTRMPNRPIDRVTPVRDCILGTSIFGSAHTLGSVRYDVLESGDSIELAIHLTGEAHSRTTGYNGPVRINSTGQTHYWASSRISLSDDSFVSAPAVASVDTHTRIRSIQKTGGRFGARLIERIAWKRAGQQKPQAERISESHTRERILREFQETIANDLAASRVRYEKEILAPLTRRGVSPEYLRMSSGPEGIGIETLFAVREQIGAPAPPPPMIPGHDMAVQIHESAVNNYLPLALSSARIAQETADNPPKLQGNIPNWLKLMSVNRPNLAAAASAGVEIVGEAQERIADAVGIEPEDSPPPPPFKPYSITLNAEAPASARFDDGNITIRVRAAELLSDESSYQNWDFIVTYQITTQGNNILLKRVGEIEVLPTGFDPEWPRQLSAEETGFRNVLKKNMNARADAGEGFPKEIPIEPIRFSRFGILVLRELVADDGWLTVGWRLP
jgi:hypothetical protein